MRVESRKNAPFRIGSFKAVDTQRGAKCSRCRKPATLTLRNAYRSSDICESEECRAREELWVGNLPHTQKTSPGTWSLDHSVADRTFKVGSDAPVRSKKVVQQRHVMSLKSSRARSA